MNADRVVFLDGLRAVATVAVLLQHYLELVAHETFLPFLRFAPGLFGVVLFFCISGYVIPFSVKNGIRPAVFLTRRMLRIFPLFLCTLTAVILMGFSGLEPFATKIRGLDGFDLIANYLLIYEYLGAPAVLGVAWTLSVEFSWYIVFMFYFMRFGHRRVVQASLIFSAGMISLAMVCVASDIRVPLGRIGMIGAAFLGYVFCCWHMQTAKANDVAKALVAFVGATALSQWVSFGHFAHPHMSLFNGIAAWFLALGLFACVAGTSVLRRHQIWAHPAVSCLGRLSFSIYLLHMPLFHLLSDVLEGATLVIAASVSTLLLAEVTYRTVELPGIALGKRWSWRSRTA